MNLITDVEKGIKVAAADALKVLTMGESVTSKIAVATPKVAAALGTVFGQLTAAITEAESAAAAGGANLVLDAATITALKAAWPDVVTFLGTMGITA